MKDRTLFKKSHTWWILIIGFAAFLILPLALYFFNGIPSIDIAGRWFSVFLGFVLSTIITFLLLERQTASQLAQKKDEKVYEEKLKVYREFIENICDAVKGFEVKKEESIKLQGLMALMSMHSPQHTEQIVKEIAHIREKTQNNDSIIIQEFNKIASIFHNELYEEHENDVVYNKVDIDKAFKITEAKLEQKPSIRDKDKIITDEETDGGDANDTPSDVADRYLSAKTHQGEINTDWDDWFLSENDSGWDLVLYSKKKQGLLGIYRWYSGDLVLEVQFPNERAFSQSVGWYEKTTLKSYKGRWRVMLKEEFRRYNSEEVIEEYHKKNSRFRHYVDAQFDKFIKYLDRYNVRVEWRAELKEKIEEMHLGWSVGIWDFDILYTDILEESLAFGRVYIDIHLTENNTKVVIIISERNHREQKVKDIKKLFPQMEEWKDEETGYLFLRHFVDAPADNKKLAEVIAHEVTCIQQKIGRAC